MSEDVVALGSGERERRRFFYGWAMLPIATMGVIATSPGQTFGISAFNPALRESLGLTHSELSGAYMLGTLLAALPMSYVGALADRYGVRRCMTGVVLLFGAACLATSQASGLITLFLSFMLLRMIGVGALGLLSGVTLAYWFERRLGFVEGIRNFGMAGAIAVFPALNLWLIEGFGWRWAFAFLGLGVWGVMLPLMLMYRNRPEDVGQVKDGGMAWPGEASAGGVAGAAWLAKQAAETSLSFHEAIRTRAFWITSGAMALWGMMVTGVLFNILPLLASRGLEAGAAAVLFTAYALSMAAFHLIGGYVADRVRLNVLLAISAALMCVSMGMMAAVGTVGGVIATGVMMGVSQALLTAVGSPIWPRYYGRAHLGKIRGLLMTIVVASSSVGPFIIGVIRDWTGGYTPSLVLFVALPLPLVVLGFYATPPKR